ncbi:hypothetical protein EPUS_08915 [Endocarpon pusillum Z07020]|uniref:Uncharacterized protein n=1 Tax=Endocarpon pusillum (strain Z07020 / HMAS-L-300199) TaxID=1263415 RepID=U1GVL7_ENDPU|nr:uncharacterized protein EPUS_08915 [Endocarpon pusillum Z07020]ERF76523.1 hypothetical protein EPUS_08915 [Endocarpon pusillum Z07020]
MHKQGRKRKSRSAKAKAYRMIVQRPLAPLERLPCEILGRIFNWSCNINLPKASWHLMKRLEDHPIYMLMLAFSSEAIYVAEEKRSSHFYARNIVLAGLPTLSTEERIRLQAEVFAKKWLQPQLVRRVQSHFVQEVIRARWAALCLEKSYGTFKIRPSQRALWCETRTEEAQVCFEVAAAHFGVLEDQGIVQFIPDCGKEVEEFYSFPACDEQSGTDEDENLGAPFPDHWYAGPWTRKERALIVQFAENRYKGHLAPSPTNSGNFASWMLHVAMLEQRIGVLLKYLVRSPGNPENDSVLYTSAINQSHFVRLLYKPGDAECKDIQMAVLLLEGSDQEPVDQSLSFLKLRLRQWLHARSPFWRDWCRSSSVDSSGSVQNEA